MAGFTMGNLASAIAAQSEDVLLVAALKAGSEDAFALLIVQYSQPLYSFIARSLHDPDAAADVTQEVFLKVFRNIRSFHGEASLKTWIYRIALHEASNQRRWWSRHKRQELTLDTPLGAGETDDGGESHSLSATLAAAAASPYDHAAQAELKARIEDALHQLPLAFRTVVVLREMEGFAYEEIAEILEVPAGTVKSRLTRGRAQLKQILLTAGLGPAPQAPAGGRL